MPPQLKTAAREGLAAAITEMAQKYPRLGLFVRTNSWATRLTGVDLEKAVVPGLTGLFVPKIDSARDVYRYDDLLDHFEAQAGVSGLEYIVPIETIHGIQNCEEIAAASDRVGAMIGPPTAEHADIAKAVGFEWSPPEAPSRCSTGPRSCSPPRPPASTRSPRCGSGSATWMGCVRSPRTTGRWASGARSCCIPRTCRW